MQYEVEMKFPVADMAALEARLLGLGAAMSSAQTEADLYFAHPARDFASTDEALRIRRKESRNYITFKGPKIDATTKTRHEIDLPLPPGEDAAVAWTGLLQALGFSAVGEVLKSRRKTRLTWQTRDVEVSLDEVKGLGTFVELELVVEAPAVEAAKQCILSLAKELDLTGTERRSYLELLMQQSAGSSGQ